MLVASEVCVLLVRGKKIRSLIAQSQCLLEREKRERGEKREDTERKRDRLTLKEWLRVSELQ